MKLSREELLELAGRDALGLLDPDESERFEAAFRRADAGLRSELRSLQDEVVAMGPLLAAAEPDDSLRAATLGRIERLIEQVPTPTLKRRVLSTFERFIEDDLHGSLQFPIAGGPAAPPRGDWIERFAAGRVSPMWRIAALVLLTTTIGLTWFGIDAYSNAMRIAGEISANRIDEILKIQFNQLPEEFWFNPETQMTAFTVAETDFKGRAMLAVINSQDRGFLAAINIPESTTPYRLLMGFEDDPDRARLVTTFYSRGGTCAVPISLGGIDDVSGANWWLMGPSATAEGTETALLQITP